MRANEHEENNPLISRMNANFGKQLFIRGNSRNSRINIYPAKSKSEQLMK